MTVNLVGGNGLRLAVDIDSGARIISLTTADGREWLAPSHPTTQSGVRPSFAHPGMGGWDEVAPTVQPDVLADGVQLGDHGDVWNVPWTELESGPGHLNLTVEIPSIHTTLSRNLMATSAGFRIAWRATTTAKVPVPLLWAAHPQFCSTPASAVSFSYRNSDVCPELIESYPVAGRISRFDGRPFDEWAAAGHSLKTFIAPGQPVDAVAIEGPGENSINLRWDPVRLPFVGLFWDNREFGAAPVFSVEPTTGFGDLASAAIEDNTVLMLSVEEPLDWWIDITA
jgi:hypothetical protein